MSFSNFLLGFFDAIDNLVSEFTFKYDVMCRFNIANRDETQHAKLSSGYNGGTCVSALINPKISRSGSRYVKDSHSHTTDCYQSNPSKVMPPVYIYDSKVKDKTKLKLRPDWCNGLPISKGQWGLGLGKDSAVDSYL